METKTAPQFNDAGNGVTQPQAVYQQGQPAQYPQQGQPMIHPTPLNGLSALPAIIDCPFCGNRSQTRVTESNSSMTIVAGVALGCICICIACLPCILHWCQDVDHFCTHCNQRVAHIPYNGIAQVVAPQQVPQQYVMGNPQQYGQQPQQQQPQQQPQPQPQQQQQGVSPSPGPQGQQGQPPQYA